MTAAWIIYSDLQCNAKLLFQEIYFAVFYQCTRNFYYLFLYFKSTNIYNVKILICILNNEASYYFLTHIYFFPTNKNVE